MTLAGRRRGRTKFARNWLDAVEQQGKHYAIVRRGKAVAHLLAATRRAGRPRGAHDLIIAATAGASSRTIVTADPGGFEGLPGLQVATHR